MKITRTQLGWALYSRMVTFHIGESGSEISEQKRHAGDVMVNVDVEVQSLCLEIQPGTFCLQDSKPYKP